MAGDPIDQRRLADPWRTGETDHPRPPGLRVDPTKHLDGVAATVFEQTDRTGDPADVTRECSIERLGQQFEVDRQSARRLRAITMRWISEVPSPIVHSFASR